MEDLEFSSRTVMKISSWLDWLLLTVQVLANLTAAGIVKL